MKITFEDPGWDWTSLLWTGLPLVAGIIVVIVATLYLKHSAPERYRGFGNSWPAGLLIALGFYAVGITGCVGLGTGVAAFYDRLESARQIAIVDSGFDSVVQAGEGEPDHTYMVNRGDSTMKITLIPDPNAEPGTYRYTVMEWNEK